MEVARSKNIVPLPPAKPHCGIRLPPDRYCLSACNYKLKPAKKTVTKTIASAATGPRMASALTATRAVVRPNSPAVRVQVPRPVMKMNTGTVAGPKIQITVPSQPAPSAVQVAPTPQFTVIKEEIIEEHRGVKREREDDDYDAP
jgi:transcription initiation factor TFIID subunit 9B